MRGRRRRAAARHGARGRRGRKRPRDRRGLRQPGRLHPVAARRRPDDPALRASRHRAGARGDRARRRRGPVDEPPRRDPRRRQQGRHRRAAGAGAAGRRRGRAGRSGAGLHDERGGRAAGRSRAGRLAPARHRGVRLRPRVADRGRDRRGADDLPLRRELPRAVGARRDPAGGGAQRGARRCARDRRHAARPRRRGDHGQRGERPRWAGHRDERRAGPLRDRRGVPVAR